MEHCTDKCKLHPQGEHCLNCKHYEVNLLKADRTHYYELAYKRAERIAELKQDICNRDEANRVLLDEVLKYKTLAKVASALAKQNRETIDSLKENISRMTD